jgi:hypothetical protein
MRDNIGIMVQILKNTMSDNVSHVCDVAPSPTRARGHVAERRAAAPRSPRRLPRRRCTYVLLSDVALVSVSAFVIIDSIEFSCRPVLAMH